MTIIRGKKMRHFVYRSQSISEQCCGGGQFLPGFMCSYFSKVYKRMISINIHVIVMTTLWDADLSDWPEGWSTWRGRAADQHGGRLQRSVFLQNSSAAYGMWRPVWTYSPYAPAGLGFSAGPAECTRWIESGLLSMGRHHLVVNRREGKDGRVKKCGNGMKLWEKCTIERYWQRLRVGRMWRDWARKWASQIFVKLRGRQREAVH